MWTQQTMKETIEERPDIIEKAILALYRKQDEDEQRAEAAIRINGRGFSGCTAIRGSYYARWILSGRHLSGAHVEKAKAICFRHITQLVEIANEKLARQKRGNAA